MIDQRRYYRIADITIQVDSDLPISDSTFSNELDIFRVDERGNDLVTIHHHFGLPNLTDWDLGKEVYRKAPWAIYQKENAWIYLGISVNPEDPTIHKVAAFNQDHSRAHIYNHNPEVYSRGGVDALTLFPTDQILIARLLADRNAVLVHSSAAILNGHGLLFVGHSGAGKSTTVNMLKNSDFNPRIEILSEDRNVIRGWEEGWRVYGTWSHGNTENLSRASAPLQAIMFLEQDTCNELVLLTDPKVIWRRLLATLIKPMVTVDWWQKELAVLEKMVNDLPCYEMHFDQSGAIAEKLINLTATGPARRYDSHVKSLLLHPILD